MGSTRSLVLAPCIVLAVYMLPLVTSRSTNASASTSSLQWIDGTPDALVGTTFGTPWPQGEHFENTTVFTLSDEQGVESPAQSWITGYWRDGSIKWAAHALPATDSPSAKYTVSASTEESQPASSANGGIKVDETKEFINVDTGKIKVTFPKSGNNIVESIETAAGKTVGKAGKLVLYSQSAVVDNYSKRGGKQIDYSTFESSISNVAVSNETSVRALVTVRGQFRVTSGKRNGWLPFVLRFYLYSGSNTIRLIQSVTYEGNPDRDFISGLGIRFSTPFDGEELYNRHVRIAGEEDGFLNEAVLGITGLRRDPGEDVRVAQVKGSETPDVSTWDTRVSNRLKWIPVWNDFSLTQLSSDGFHLKKRTKEGQGWLDISSGSRSGGLAYLGGATTGGLAIGLRDFWKQFPTGLEISNAASSEAGDITLWLYSPEARPLDLRSYHDGMGQDTYEKQLDALEVTYEDFEPGFDSPTGIAKTHEVYIAAFDHTPPSDELAKLGNLIQNPPHLYPEPSHVRETKALGTYWDIPETSNEKAAAIERTLDFLVKFYRGQVEDHRWYGFLHYGDFMHSYDEDRHTWRYDIGGYAWDNSELSPDLFFWQYFLRTGRADVFRFAEALTRHGSEVDTYHTGDWKGLGSRHAVQHWVDSAKQVRINQPQYRKYYYYVSGGDERIGELLDEALDTDKSYSIVDPGRKVRTDGWTPKPGQPTAISLGTDWSALAGGWLIGWERRGKRSEEAKEKLLGTVAGIANLTNGFVTGSGLYDIESRTLGPPPADPDNKGIVSVGNLGAVFGQPEVVLEIIEYLGDELPDGFKDAWLDYCFYHGAGRAAQVARYGEAFGSRNLVQGHSRLAAYFASDRDNSTLAKRAWNEFYGDGLKAEDPWASEEVRGPIVLNARQEAAFVSTNAASQYGLAAIQNLAFVGDQL